MVECKHHRLKSGISGCKRVGCLTRWMKLPTRFSFTWDVVVTSFSKARRKAKSAIPADKRLDRTLAVLHRAEGFLKQQRFAEATKALCRAATEFRDLWCADNQNRHYRDWVRHCYILLAECSGQQGKLGVAREYQARADGLVPIGRYGDAWKSDESISSTFESARNELRSAETRIQHGQRDVHTLQLLEKAKHRLLQLREFGDDCRQYSALLESCEVLRQLVEQSQDNGTTSEGVTFRAEARGTYFALLLARGFRVAIFISLLLGLVLAGNLPVGMLVVGLVCAAPIVLGKSRCLTEISEWAQLLTLGLGGTRTRTITDAQEVFVSRDAMDSIRQWFFSVQNRSDDLSERLAFWISRHAPQLVQRLMLQSRATAPRLRGLFRIAFVAVVVANDFQFALALLTTTIVETLVVVPRPLRRQGSRAVRNLSSSWAVLLRCPIHLARGDGIAFI